MAPLQDVVASFNIVQDPARPGQWLGYYEGGMPASGKEDWTLGLARASNPLGPWTKDPRNPILNGNLTCDRSRQFNPKCGGPADRRGGDARPAHQRRVLVSRTRNRRAQPSAL